MNASDYKHELEQALSSKPLASINPKNHWLYVPEEIRKAILKACEGLDIQAVSQIAGFDIEALERWLTEEKSLQELKERFAYHEQYRAPNTPYSPKIRPAVCKLANMTSTWTAMKALGIPRSTIKRWLERGWGEIDIKDTADEIDANLDQPPLMPAIPSGEEISSDPLTRQLELFLERHKGKIRKKYSLAEKKLILQVVERFGSKAVHEKFKVSYDTIARLKKQANTAFERKAHIPMRYIPVVELMKKHPGMGPTQIRDFLKRHHGLAMGVNSIRKVMEQNGWVPPFVRATRVNTDIRFYEAVRRNYMWHMDFKHHYINQFKAFILFIQDDQSRFIVGHTVTDSENLEDVLIAMEEAIRIHGKPESVMSDGGSAFFSWRGSSKFARFLEDFGIDQLISKTPNINGKVENLNQQLEKELLLTTNFSTLKHFNSELAKWVGFYNFTRPHQGLTNNQVPADRYFPGAAQWYGEVKERINQQSLIAETMGTLLAKLNKAS